MAGAAANPVAMIATLPLIYAMVIVAGIVATHWAMRDKTLELVIEKTPPLLLGTIWAAMGLAVIAEQGKGSAFIYFQF
jgi:alginate O-acetyltransferase complex protein AlgI